MTVDSWIALVVVAIMIVVLVADRLSPVIVLGGALVTLLFAGVIEADVALSGFSSTAPATVAALYIMAGAATATGLLAGVVDRVLDRSRSVGPLAAVTAALSAIIPNTPLIAMFAPQVVRWADKNSADVSKYLMPMSFASILGGVVTVIGTSTNLVVSDLLEASGEQPLGVFEVTVIGLPIAVVGVFVLSTLGTRLLPSREGDQRSVRAEARQFQIAMAVESSGPVVGRTVEAAGLRNLPGVYLSFVERSRSDGEVSAIPATPDTVIEAGDVCCFVGDVDRVVDLHEIPGLRSTEATHIGLSDGVGTRVHEAVVSPASSLVGQSLRAAEFRGRFGGAVMAIHRADERLVGQLGRIDLRAGDVLLVLADNDFELRWRGHSDFSLVAALDGSTPLRRRQAPFVAMILTAFVLASTTGLLTLFEAALGAAIGVVFVGALSLGEARRAIDLNVIMTMAVAISLGGAIQASGLANQAASIIQRVDFFGDRGLVLVTVLITIALSELLTNTAAAALMIPVVLSVASDLGVEPRLLAMSVLFAASCSFLSPIGYQTNLMVAGLGGYRFTDFSRVGAPLTISAVIIVTVLAPVAFG